MNDAKLIYDVGMNNGDDTAYYLYRGYRVVAIEADPTLAEAGQRRFAKAISQGRLTILNVGVGPEEGVIPFWICEGKSEWNSFDKEFASRCGRKCHSIDVPCRRFADIVKEHGDAFYIKIDIEGHDRHCLEDLTSTSRPEYLSCEMGGVPLLNQFALLGYTKFKIVIQNDFSQLQPGKPHWWQRLEKQIKLYTLFYRLNAKRKEVFNRRQQEQLEAGTRSHGNWTFNYGSSGPISAELPGEWQTLAQTTETWEEFAAGRSAYGRPNLGLWFDLHATA